MTKASTVGKIILENQWINRIEAGSLMIALGRPQKQKTLEQILESKLQQQGQTHQASLLSQGTANAASLAA